MGLVSLLFSFNGRINRLQFWLGSLGAALVGFSVILGLLVSTGMSLAAAKSSEAALRSLLSFGLIFIPIWLALGWIGLALQFKRFHDRGRTGFLTLLPAAISAPMTATLVSGALTHAPADQVAASAQPFAIALWFINLAFFIDLGCLPGVNGPNKYGDPPGAPRSPRPTAPRPAQPAGAHGAHSLLAAQSAIDRAIAEQASRASASAPTPALAPARAPQPRPAAPTRPSFGRRAAH